MGEEEKKKEEEGKKEESKKEEEKKNDEKKEEESSPPEAEEIVLKVDMHCEACARKVAKALKGFQGVEKVSADSKGSKVVVKGKAADPIKVLQRLQKKSGKKVELISPLPKPQQEGKKEDEPTKKEEPHPPPQENKDQPPPVVTIVLKVRMHCEACAQGIQKRIRKIQGVESVETELGKDQVIVKGVIDAAKLVEEVYKRTKKHASVVKTEEEEKKEEEKKEEEEKKKEEKEEQEKKEAEAEEKKGEGEGEDDDHNKSDIKRSEYWPSKSFVDYAYAPQIFSDENPNACSVM